MPNIVAIIGKVTVSFLSYASDRDKFDIGILLAFQVENRVYIAPLIGLS